MNQPCDHPFSAATLSMPDDPRLLLHHDELPLLPPPQHSHPQQAPQNQQLTSDENDAPSIEDAVVSSSISNLVITEPLDPHEATEDMLMAPAHQKYTAGNYNQALLHSLSVYERNSQRTDNLLLLDAINSQLRYFDISISKTEETLQFDQNFAECYGNMAYAWEENGNVDVAILCYLRATELRPDCAVTWSNLAGAYMYRRRFNEADLCYRQALPLNPHSVCAHNNLGNLMKAQGLVQEAYNCYVEALRIEPKSSTAWSNIASLFMEAGDLNNALKYYKEIVKLKPTSADAYLKLGNLYNDLGMPEEADICYQRALQCWPDSAMAFGLLARIYYDRGQIDMAIVNYNRAIYLDLGFLDEYYSLGNALKDSGRNEIAIECYLECLALQPSHPQSLTMLRNTYMERNMLDIAASLYKATLEVTSGLSAPFKNLAAIYKQQANYSDAITCYSEVLRIDPLDVDGLINRGNIYKMMGRVSEAIQDYLRAINISPSDSVTHADLALVYEDSGNFEAAIKSYREALSLCPNFPEATCNLLHTLQSICDWEERESNFIEVEAILRREIKMSVLPSVQPFHALAYPLDPMLVLEISRQYADSINLDASRYSLPPFSYPSPFPVKCQGGSGRLRVGYVSSDFGNHPVSHLMGSVFGMHDRENIEVFCYALSTNNGTKWRHRTESEAEHFIDVSSTSSDLIAETINDHKIQILVNLNGYTEGARNEVFALQPAPIQISYMGFPGTTGASYIHYLVSDEFVCPLQFAELYSEKLVHLPHCYFVNDYKQKNLAVLDPSCIPKRSDYGLPEDKFIFACFNQLCKIDPDIFNTWCNILKRVPNSAIWLLRFPAAGEMKLRAYASQKGVQQDQIIFSDVAMKDEHISRSALADLFLDTPMYNGHTTGTDVLWAGLPMVTFPLETMSRRVAGSLCMATGLGEEMIVNSLEEYEERAVALALNRPELQNLTDRLKSVRLTCPLFDTARWVRNLERAYFKMWNLHCSGQHPQHFKVTENDSDFPYDR